MNKRNELAKLIASYNVSRSDGDIGWDCDDEVRRVFLYFCDGEIVISMWTDNIIVRGETSRPDSKDLGSLFGSIGSLALPFRLISEIFSLVRGVSFVKKEVL